MSDSGKGVPGKKLDSHYMRLKNKKEKCQYCGVLMKHGSLVRHITRKHPHMETKPKNIRPADQVNNK